MLSGVSVWYKITDRARTDPLHFRTGPDRARERSGPDRSKEGTKRSAPAAATSIDSCCHVTLKWRIKGEKYITNL